MAANAGSVTGACATNSSTHHAPQRSAACDARSKLLSHRASTASPDTRFTTMIDHKSLINRLVEEFDQRNPERSVIIDYAVDVAEETGYPAEVVVPHDDDETSLILLDIDAPISSIIGYVAKGLASVEAGFSADDDTVQALSDHYISLVEFEIAREFAEDD